MDGFYLVISPKIIIVYSFVCLYYTVYFYFKFLTSTETSGKSRLKYDLRSYQEMVVIPMKQMSEDNQQLVWLKNKVIKQEQRSKALEETFGVVTQKLRETMEENRIVRLRTKIQHEENKEEVMSLLRYYYDINFVYLLLSKVFSPKLFGCA